jgi:hypothetical protein
MDLQTASTRLRTTFKYPTDDSSSTSSHDALDEQSQDELLTSLRAADTSSNNLYTIIFTTLPLLTIPLFIYLLFLHSALRSLPLLALLSLTSLLATAYTMRFIPLHPSSTPGPIQLARPALFVDADSPVQTLLPWLNLAIAVLLLLSSYAVKGRSSAPEALWLFLLLPAIMLGVVSFARKSMKDVLVGIGELEGKRYGYKGA